MICITPYKIGIISTAAIACPPPEYGGIELITWLLADGLSKRGHDVTLIAPQGSRPPNDNVKILPTVNIQTQAFQENTAIQYYADKLKDYDIIHDHSHSKMASYYIKENNLNVAYLPTVHNMSTIAYPMRKPSVTALSRAHADWIESRHGYKTDFVYNGLNVMDFVPILNRKLKTNRYFICGRPNPEKNLLEAIDLCKKANVPCDVVAGRLSIEPVDYCIKVASACLFGTPWKYYGQVPNDDKNRLMAKAKATLITYGGRDSRSYYIEPFGLVAIESLLVGTPVVAYDCGAIRELIREGKDGFVVPRNDQEAFIRAMKEVDSLDLEDIRINASEQWSHDRMSEDYERLYKKILSGNRW